MSPLLSIDNLMVFGIETKETLVECFFFFGFSASTYLEVDRERCFLWLVAALLEVAAAPVVVLARADSLNTLTTLRCSETHKGT